MIRKKSLTMIAVTHGNHQIKTTVMVRIDVKPLGGMTMRLV